MAGGLNCFDGFYWSRSMPFSSTQLNTPTVKWWTCFWPMKFFIGHHWKNIWPRLCSSVANRRSMQWKQFSLIWQCRRVEQTNVSKRFFFVLCVSGRKKVLFDFRRLNNIFMCVNAFVFVSLLTNKWNWSRRKRQWSFVRWKALLRICSQHFIRFEGAASLSVNWLSND